MLGLARRLFGTANDRYLKRLRPLVDKVNLLEPEIENLSDEALKGKTSEFRRRLENGETEDDLLPEAFAVVREAARRTLGQRHFDVQILGGIVLHHGQISEMKTGEGKTLVATLPVYLKAISGKGVHVVTVNDYLARRDAEWMGQVYEFLGLSVGAILTNQSDSDRRDIYGRDVIYATNNVVGFDYLRDNMKFSMEDMVQRPFHYAIVDEVDFILIDEARTPLIISGPAEDSSEKYVAVDKLIPMLSPEHYEKDEKERSIMLTETGIEKMEELMEDAGLLAPGGLYDVANVGLVHHVEQALRAHHLFERDDHYIVKDDKVIIIDEFTGRMMEGRRYSDGLHQAIEAKEGVSIQSENQTLASITFQNLFRLYPKLAGMTGTAMTEADEFQEIYKLESVEIPTNEPVRRKDHDDEVYRTLKEKNDSIIALLKDCHERGQPALVGTTSIEKSEALAAQLKKETGISPQVLNARHHEQEAYIVAQAGVPGAITIATNMAGRGTDIQLGGNLDMRLERELDGVEDPDEREKLSAKIHAEIEDGRNRALEGGGLYVVGTERHESRRIDNQLRGRSGRQGDPGASKFFLSLEDDLMRIFGSERMNSMLTRLGIEEGEAIMHPWINKALEKAQSKVEARNFDIRKTLLKYDDVMNDQRKVVYEQRRELMSAEDVSDTIEGMRYETINDLVSHAIPEKVMPDAWDLPGLKENVQRTLGLDLPVDTWGDEEGVSGTEIQERLRKAADEKMAEKENRFGAEAMRIIEKSMLLQILDQTWKEHLLALDHLRQTITLRAYGQRDPLNEYKREAFDMFSDMLETVRERITSILAHVELSAEAELENIMPDTSDLETLQAIHQSPDALVGDNVDVAEDDESKQTPFRHASGENADPNRPETWGKVPRNAACPCGSGKKYKHCHGRVR